MFKPLGLLTAINCPDHKRCTCEARRPNCIFSHAFKPDTGVEDNSPAAVVEASKRAAGKVTSASSSVEETPGASAKAKAKAGFDPLSGRYGSVNPKPTSSAPPSRPQSITERINKMGTTGGASRSTSLGSGSKFGRTPELATRRETTTKLREAFLRLYMLALPPLPKPSESTKSAPPSLSAARSKLVALLQDLATEHAGTQEAAVNPNNKQAYKNTTIMELGSLKKRAGDALVGKALLESGRQALKVLEASGVDVDEGVKRARETMEDCLEVGVSSERSKKARRASTKAEGKLSRARLQELFFIAPRHRLGELGYPAPWDAVDGAKDEPLSDDLIEKAWGEGGQGHALGSTQRCSRCSKDFVVRDVHADLQEATRAREGLEKELEGRELEERSEEDRNRLQEAMEREFKAQARMEECKYHWGKRRFEREMGSSRSARVARFTCCNRLDLSVSSNSSTSIAAAAQQAGMVVLTGDEGENFCSSGPHVFKEEDDGELHWRERYRSSRGVREDVEVMRAAEGMRDGEMRRWDETEEIVALDAELVATTAGLSLARITLVNERGELLLDAIVRPRWPVVDLMTRFSGMTQEQLDDPAAISLEEAQRQCVRFVGPDTVLVGHGLENDLRALRLSHDVITDSALLLPHQRGLPYRQSLRDLVSKHLGRIVQNAGEKGHSSAEDARDALEVVRWKVMNDGMTSPFRERRREGEKGGGGANVATASASHEGATREDGPSNGNDKNTNVPPSTTAASTTIVQPQRQQQQQPRPRAQAQAQGQAQASKKPPPKRPAPAAANFLFVPKKARK